MSEVTDKLFAEAVKAYCQELPGFPSDAVHSDLVGDAAGFRAALSVAFAAGVASVTQGAKTQWGIRRTGFKSVRITSDTKARSLLRNFLVPGEMVMREVGPWEVVTTNADLLAQRDGGVA
jgi:hypothetical protein